MANHVARGIHDHPTRKLGLKHHDKAAGQLLTVEFKAAAYDYPMKADYSVGVSPGLDGNDRFGTCGPTSGDNSSRTSSRHLLGTEIDAALDQVFDVYRAAGNPQFDPSTGEDDEGVTMPDLLGALRSVGFGDRKLLCYGRLADTSDQSIYAAIDTFGSVLMAVDLKTAQQGQRTWDYVSGSAEWGGHAVCAVKYDAEAGLVWDYTWAELLGMTKAFRLHQLDEVWVPIWPEFLTSAKLFDRVDWSSIQDQFRSLTGQTLPDRTTPTPPAPTGGSSLSITDAAVWQHIQHSAALSKTSPDAWAQTHFRKYFQL